MIAQKPSQCRILMLHVSHCNCTLFQVLSWWKVTAWSSIRAARLLGLPSLCVAQQLACLVHLKQKQVGYSFLYYCCLLCFYNIISNEELWSSAQEKPMAVQIKLQLWKWVRHTSRKGSWAAEKQALFSNPQGKCRRGRPRRSRRKIEEETEIVCNTWREFKATAGNRVNWRCFMEALCCKVE